MRGSNWLAETGVALAGTAVKEAVKLLPGGGLVVAGAEIIGELAESILGDISTRTLSKREELRVGATASFALKGIKERLSEGEKLRDDDYFFANNEYYRSDAAEAFEGILLQSKIEHEEKKLEYISNIFINTAFNDSISIGVANHSISLLERLTYRQLVIIVFVKSLEKSPFEETYGTKSEIEKESIMQEMFDLIQLGLIFNDLRDTIVVTPSSKNISFDKLTLTVFGKQFYELMSLEKMSFTEVENLMKKM